jgi:hypothetical protein
MMPLALATRRVRNMSRISPVGARFIVPVSPWRPEKIPHFNSSSPRVLAPLSTHHAKSLTRLQRSDLECGSSAAAFPNDSHNSLFGRLTKWCQPARAASVSASTSTPRAISSGDAYSSGRWLNPLRQGINSIATGAIRDIKSES